MDMAGMVDIMDLMDMADILEATDADLDAFGAVVILTMPLCFLLLSPTHMVTKTSPYNSKKRTLSAFFR
ncbi:hypothetical protein CUU64_14235 [Bacillus sp. V5-8f]|nr:hypothetical protein CUU64_14235 [Bacillus sp. V5-8f]